MEKTKPSAEAKVAQKRTPAERSFQLKEQHLKAFLGNPKLIKAFLDAYNENNEEITPMLFAQAVGATRQTTLEGLN
nr:MAG: hypothetical protein [Microviridae sp.]